MGISLLLRADHPTTMFFAAAMAIAFGRASLNALLVCFQAGMAAIITILGWCVTLKTGVATFKVSQSVTAPYKINVPVAAIPIKF